MSLVLKAAISPDSVTKMNVRNKPLEVSHSLMSIVVKAYTDVLKPYEPKNEVLSFYESDNYVYRGNPQGTDASLIV